MSARRSSLVLLAVLIVWAGLGSGAGPAGEPEAAAQTSKPNVLIILTDDQRSVGTLGVMPATTARFVDGGTTYTQAYAPTPLCCPARATLMTGRYAHNTGVRNNAEASRLNHQSTLQRYLRSNGYWTGIFGKFLNRWGTTKGPPNFDRWAVMDGGYYNQKFNSNGAQITVKQYSTDYVAARATSFLNGAEANDSQPWLMILTPYAPHWPHDAEPAYETASVPAFSTNSAILETDLSDKPQYVRDHWQSISVAKSRRTAQLRTLMSVDDLVEQTFATMGRLGEQGNTIALFASDNGFLWREHGLIGKTYPYTQSIRTPMYLWGPGRGIGAGVTDVRPVTLADFLPTVLEMAGIAPDPAFPIDGRSLRTTFTRDRLLTEYWQEGPTPGAVGTPTWASIRTSTYQYVEYYAADAQTVIYREYYDLVNDSAQNFNLLGDASTANDPDVTGIAEQLHADRTCVGTSGETACP